MDGRRTEECHWNMEEGEVIALTEDEALEVLESAEAETAKRRELMPDEQAAIRMFFEAWLRLKELGWREAMYAPKDGTGFDAIEPGSTEIHLCHYCGEWPEGDWWISAHGDLYSARPVLFRKKAQEHLPK